MPNNKIDINFANNVGKIKALYTTKNILNHQKQDSALPLIEDQMKFNLRRSSNDDKYKYTHQQNHS